MVEINLLGEKEKRNIAPLIMGAIILIISVGLSVYGYMLDQAYSTQLSTLEQSLQSTKQLNDIYEQKLSQGQTTSTVDDLKATIEWVKTFPTPTVYLIEHLTSLLPGRGFIINFSYSDEGTLNLTVQTDTNREIAYFLKYLNESPYFTDVNLNSITTNPIATVGENSNTENTITAFENKEYVPRYIGLFQLKVDKEAIKQKVEKEGNAK